MGRHSADRPRLPEQDHAHIREASVPSGRPSRPQTTTVAATACVGHRATAGQRKPRIGLADNSVSATTPRQCSKGVRQAPIYQIQVLGTTTNHTRRQNFRPLLQKRPPRTRLFGGRYAVAWLGSSRPNPARYKRSVVRAQPNRLERTGAAALVDPSLRPGREVGSAPKPRLMSCRPWSDGNGAAQGSRRRRDAPISDWLAGGRR
jgi:hypothetical protein